MLLPPIKSNKIQLLVLAGTQLYNEKCMWTLVIWKAKLLTSDVARGIPGLQKGPTKENAFMLNLYYALNIASHIPSIVLLLPGIPETSPSYPQGQSPARVSKYLQLALFQHCITHFHRKNTVMHCITLSQEKQTDRCEINISFLTFLSQCLVYKERTTERQEKKVT